MFFFFKFCIIYFLHTHGAISFQMNMIYLILHINIFGTLMMWLVFTWTWFILFAHYYFWHTHDIISFHKHDLYYFAHKYFLHTHDVINFHMNVIYLIFHINIFSTLMTYTLPWQDFLIDKVLVHDEFDTTTEFNNDLAVIKVMSKNGRTLR